ncbi:NAD-dependent epimerase/dehydratase family protein [Candidatus Parcubacteria bacterium]|nr:MAG: NAD-dependent epimerase/dehydratase family protein [Candidatus Parcubacteria bacterium]
MAKIFVSGVAGFLGSHLADSFIADGHQVVGCDNLFGGYLDNVPPKVEFHQYDCNFLNSMIKITKDVDVVYHCAAAAYEGLSVFSPFFISQNVFQNTVSLMTASIVNKVKRFVFCSSMARYGSQAVPFKEDMTPKPQDPYGIAKYAAELVIKNLAEVHGIDFVIAVPHNIIGPRQKYDDPYRNVASIMINMMLQNKPPIIYGDGGQKRCFSFVQDCVAPLKEMAFSKQVVNETINIGPDEEFITINELFGVLAEMLDFKQKPVYLADRPQEVKLATCSAEKARQLVGYRTSFKLKDGLQTIIDYIRERGPKPFKYHIDLEIINKKTPRSWSEKMF